MDLLEGALGSSARGMPKGDIEAAAHQMAGLLPVDVRGVAADAFSAAAAEALTLKLGGEEGADCGERADASPPASSRRLGMPGSAPAVEARHLATALARVKARTATEIGAPQVTERKVRCKTRCTSSLPSVSFKFTSVILSRFQMFDGRT